ncbi:MAG: HAD family phosphatase [Roseburia sp.]|nr:HAD family phosphatase [Roseburia sp.]
MSEIKNVIFDIGDVLVSFRWRALMEDLGLPEELQETFREKVFLSPWWGELDHGLQEEAVIIEKLREDNREHLEEFELVWENREKLVDPFPYSVAWIERLKARGLKVYLLSNYPRDIFTLHAENGSFPFLDKVDGRVVSGFVRMVKPNVDIYEYLMREYGLLAKECVFLDDREENVNAARALGMKGIVVESYEQASAELDALTGGET